MLSSTPLRKSHSKVIQLLACSHTTIEFNEYGIIASQSANQNCSNILTQSSIGNG